MKQLLRVVPVAVIAALVVPAMNPHVAAASPIDQQRDRVEDIVDELERLEERAREIGEDYVIAIEEKQALDTEIEDLEDDIEKKEGELEELRADLGDMAVRSFVGSGTTPLGPLFEDTGDVNDVLQRDQLAEVALSAGDGDSDELDALVTDLEDDREELADKIEQSEELAASLEAQQAATEEKTGEYQQARIEAEEELGELIAQEEARRAAESAARLQAEIEAAQAAAAAEAAESGSSSSGSTSSGNTNSATSSSTSSDSSNSGTSNSDSGTTSSGNTSTGNTSTSSSSSDSGSSTPAPAPAPATPAPAPTPSAPPPSSRAGTAVNAALGQQGVPYRYATSSPGVSFDCSGLTSFAWAQAGVYLPRQSRSQYAAVPHVSQSSAQPGDLLFFYSPISHVSIYLGGGQHVHAPNTGSVVSVASVNWGNVTGVGRPG